MKAVIGEVKADMEEVETYVMLYASVDLLIDCCVIGW